MTATNLPDTITYWLPTANNGTGGKTWSSGAAIPARVAHTAGTVTTREGKTVSYTDVAYAETEVPTGAYVAFSDESGASEPIDGARQVIDSTSNPTMATLSRMVL